MTVEQEDIARAILHCKMLCENKMTSAARCMKIELPIAVAVEVVKKCAVVIGWSRRCVLSLESLDRWPKCFRCLMHEHIVGECTGEAAGDVYYRCRVEGYRITGCRVKLKCPA